MSALAKLTTLVKALFGIWRGPMECRADPHVVASASAKVQAAREYAEAHRHGRGRLQR